MRKYFPIILALLLLLAAPLAFSATINTTIAPGDTLRVSCSTQLSFVPDSGQAAAIVCAANASATATATASPEPTSTPTASPEPTITPGPSPTPPPASASIWVSPAELAALPMSGPAWENVKAAALGSQGSANLSDLNSNHDVFTEASALYAMRTGDQAIRARVAEQIISAIGTESSSRALEVSRNITSYVIAADLIHLATFDPAKDAQFRAFIGPLRTQKMTDGKTIISSHEGRPNNWGTHAGAARVAIDRYLGDTVDLARAWHVFQGWAGDRSVYAGFSYGELSWQCDPAAPVGINPPCLKNGHDIGGVLPDDQRRAGSFTWPAPDAEYMHEGMQGALWQADLLARAGYPAFAASASALLRSEQWAFTNNNVPHDDDLSNVWIVNHYYGTHFAADPNATHGKSGGWTAWVYQ